MELDGILLINKEENMTSRDVDNLIQKKFKTKKVGHLGTLDPFATGLLILAINKGTKLLNFIDDSYKEYVAILKLGEFKDTGDLTGKTLEKCDVRKYEKSEIIEVLQGFLGFSYQLPPMYSAIKINGKELYKYAYNNKDIDKSLIKERKIEIKEIELLDYMDDEITFRCVVSSGTYIRTLGEDIAKKLGSAGFLIKLNRTRVGNYNLKNAIKLNEINENNLIKYNEVELKYKKVKLDDFLVKKLIYGQLIELPFREDYFIAIDKDENLIACCSLLENKDDSNTYKYSVLRGLF